MKKLLLTISLFGTLFSTQSLSAENAPYIEIHAGVVVPRDADVDLTVATVPFTGSISFKERELFGGEFGFANLAGSGFRIGASVLSTKMKLEEVCINGGACAAATDELDHLIYMGRVYYDFYNQSPLTPYIGIGAGFSDVENTGTDVAGSLVGGANFRFSNNVYLGLRGEYIYANTQDTADDGTTTTIIDGQDFWSVALVLGFPF